MSKVAVIGNTARAIGAVCASDLTLSGHEVRYTVFPEQKDQLPEVRKAGGFTVEGDAKHLISKKTGFARLDKVCDTTAEALKDAEAVLIEVDIHQLEEKFSAMIPEFARGAVVHVQSHGYWPAARLTPLLRKAGREDVLVTEAPAPTHAARIDGTVVTPKGLRSGIRIATVPASRSDEALARLKPLFPYFTAASSVLQTGLENLNLIVHPAMVLPNIAAMERAKLDGRKFGFYQEGVAEARADRRPWPAWCLRRACSATRSTRNASACARPMASRIRRWRRRSSSTTDSGAIPSTRRCRIPFTSLSRLSSPTSGARGHRMICVTPSCRACSLPSRRGLRCRCTARLRKSLACCSASTRGSAGPRSPTWTSRVRRRR